MISRGQWAMPYHTDMYQKLNDVLNHLVAADNGPRDKFYHIGLNGTDPRFDWGILDPVLPFFVASGHDSGVFVADNIYNDGAHRATGDDCVLGGSCDAWSPWPYGDCNEDDECKVYYTGINELATRHFMLNPPQVEPRRWGIVLADFPGPGLVDEIIRANFLNVYLPAVLRGG
jgi:1-phosphatidylinositol phosphodiesterase